MFRRFFIGRNGPDQLSLVIMLLAAIISFIPWRYIWIVSAVLFAVVLWRMLSRNVEQRRKENLAFMNLVNKIRTWYYKTKAKSAQRKLYKVFKCPQCGQKLRVPRGKGKVSIKCSKCGNRMMRTT
jgi:predicted RNA-binding Zn-ribbon protein involved in translation (DUF1610 family)